MNSTINFAVIGCGMLAQAQHIPNIARSSRMNLHTCCDLDEDALRLCQEQFGAQHISKDFQATISNPEVEAICLATTEKLRLPVIAAAAAAGKPIYVEKPVAPTLPELYEIQRIVNDADIPFCAGHNRRSGPSMQDAYAIFRQHMTAPQPCPWRFDRESESGLRPKLAEDGVAGLSVRINDDWYSWKGWVFNPEEAQFGPMLFEMTHFTDLCNWLLDAKPKSVASLETGLFNHGVVITYETGELATITMCSNGTFGYPKELYEMFGNGAAVVVDHMLEVRTAGIASAPARKVYPMLHDRHPDVGQELGLSGWLAKKQAACREAAEQGDSNLIFTAEPNKGHREALERFVDEIRGKGPVVCGIDDAVMATRVAFAAITAAAERRVVDIAEI